MNFDVSLFRFINDTAGRFPALDTLGIFAAVFLLPLLAFLLIPAAFTIKRLREAHWYELPLKALVAATAAYGIRTLIGVLASRPRPFIALADTNLLVSMDHAYDSFPSGHSALAFALAFVIFRADRDWGIAFLILAMFVAIGRVFVGVHYPLDIVGGAVVGWFGAWIVHKLEHAHWSKFERALRSR